MPFLAVGGLLGGLAGAGTFGAGAAALAGGGALAGITTGIGLASAAQGAIGSSKSGYTPSQVNIDQLNEQTKAISNQNALDSAALEQQLTPEVPQLRSQANNAVIGGIDNSPAANQSLATLLAGMGTGNPLLQEAIAKARTDLQLGGQLPQDVQNLVTRKALAQGGAVAGPGGGLGLGRDLVTRDLGLTSLDLGNQRLQTALQAGGLESTDTINRANLIAQLQQAQFGRALGAAQYGQSIQQPNVGIDPSSAANISVANINAQNAAKANQANIKGQTNKNLLNFGGQLLGNGLLSYNNIKMGGAGSGYDPNTNWAKRLGAEGP